MLKNKISCILGHIFEKTADFSSNFGALSYLIAGTLTADSIYSHT